MQSNRLWQSSWQRSPTEAEKCEEEADFEAWRAQRLDESRDDDPAPERSVSHRRPRRVEPEPVEYEEYTAPDESWPPSPETKMKRFFMWRWLSKFIPKGYGTYAAVAAWIVINVLAAAGYPIPGFDVVEGNEGAGINLGLAIAYLRRAMGK